MFFDSTVSEIAYNGPAPGQHTLNGCASCGTTTGPFASGSSHGSTDAIYLCKTCVGVAARSIGCLAPEDVAILHGQLDETAEALEKAHADLESLKQNMSVPLAEVIDLVREREKRRPSESIPA